MNRRELGQIPDLTEGRVSRAAIDSWTPARLRICQALPTSPNTSLGVSYFPPRQTLGRRWLPSFRKHLKWRTEWPLASRWEQQRQAWRLWPAPLQIYAFTCLLDDGVQVLAIAGRQPDDAIVKLPTAIRAARSMMISNFVKNPGESTRLVTDGQF